MPQAANADHADFFTRPDVPVAQRRVGRDPGAQQRRDGGQLLSGWRTAARSVLMTTICWE
jgi:hypothetical protein